MKDQARSARAVWVMCLISAIGWIGAPARVEAQPLSSIEFSFSNPGARSLGLGGAFVAVADDATAAFANPAGLVMIVDPEVSFELRSWGYTTPFTSGGRASGVATGFGLDTVAFPLRSESTVDISGLSFVSYVYPKKHWSAAIFRHQLANFEFGLETQGLFGAGPGVAGTVRTEIQTSQVDLEILTHGLALAFRPIDRLSIGIGLSHFATQTNFIGWDYLPDEDSFASSFAAATFRPDRLVQIVDMRSDDTDWGFAVGLLWRLADRWSLGSVFREGSSSLLKLGLEAGPANPDFPEGVRYVDGFPLTWNFPDVYKLGLAYRSRDGRWTGALEWKRVEYSSVLESFLPQQRDQDDRLDDADEIHLGGEYAFFAGTSVLAVRLGIWHDPDHQIRSETDPAENPFITAILPSGEDELHFAAGLGLAFDRFQIDFGIDISERVGTAALSTIYSF
jgi:long-subunit fatty acid transport protein